MPIRVLIMLAFAVITGCSSSTYDPHISATENQVATRSYQTRTFDGVGREELLQAVISTLQDYHFRIRELDASLGVISAYQTTAFDRGRGVGGRTELTVFVKPRHNESLSLRVNMSTGQNVENKPELYQQFFAAVRKTLHQHGKA